jgi:hypothetical protein
MAALKKFRSYIFSLHSIKRPKHCTVCKQNINIFLLLISESKLWYKNQNYISSIQQYPSWKSIQPETGYAYTQKVTTILQCCNKFWSIKWDNGHTIQAFAWRNQTGSPRTDAYWLQIKYMITVPNHSLVLILNCSHTCKIKFVLFTVLFQE